MDCSTIIVSYNTFELTVEAVRSAARSAASLKHEIIVIDNASPDGSGRRLKELFGDAPGITIIANDENPGFSTANNQGAEKAQGRILFFLNPDTVVHEDAIPILCQFLETRHDVGAVGPLVLNADGTVQPSTFKVLNAREIIRQHLPLGSLLLGRDHRIDPVPERTSPVDVVRGCALAIRRNTFDEIGGWDESYFMYSEETEMCYKLLKLGYSNYFVREARITHFGGASTMDQYSEQQIVIEQSAIQFLRKHHSTALLMLHRWSGLVGFSLRVPLFAVLSRVRPEKAAEYRRRGSAARRLVRWFMNEYE